MTDEYRIDLIDTDPAAFGPAGIDDAPSSPPRPGWVVPVAVAACAAVATVALLVWQPWARESEPPLSNRLALSTQPYNEVESVEIEAAWDGPSAAEVGFVYADADAVLPRLRGGTGRSVRWVAYARDSAFPVVGALPSPPIQGSPATVVVDASSTVQVDFGPIDGRRFTVTANGLTVDDAVALAEQIGVVDGEPVLRDPAVLLGMEPIGSLASLDTAVALAGGDLPVARRPFTEIDYVEGNGRISVASAADPTGEVEQMLRLLLDGTIEPTVEGRDRLIVDVRDLSEGRMRTLVGWRERGRLIVVRGPGDIAATREVADAVVELPPAQWQQIARLAAPPGAGGYNRRIGSVGAFPARIGLIGVGLDGFGEIVATPLIATGGGPRGWSLCLFTEVGVDCTASPITDEPPSVRVHSIHGVRILLALAPAGAHEPMLRVTRNDAVELHLLFRPGGDRTLAGPAVAVAVDDDVTVVELLVDGEVVATL